MRTLVVERPQDMVHGHGFTAAGRPADQSSHIAGDAVMARRVIEVGINRFAGQAVAETDTLSRRVAAIITFEVQEAGGLL